VARFVVSGRSFLFTSMRMRYKLPSIIGNYSNDLLARRIVIRKVYRKAELPQLFHVLDLLP